MFEGSLVESRNLLRTNNRWTGLVSVLLQATAVLALVALPLLHPEALPYTLLKPQTLTAPPPPVRLKPVPVQPAQAATAGSMQVAIPASPERIFTFNRSMDSAPIAALQPFTMSSSSVPSDLVPSIGTGPHIGTTTTSAPPNPAKPVRISGGIAQGMLLAPLHPVYPQIAIATRTEGTVVVQAVISKTGTIESLHVTSGPAMLTGAALDAIRAARYAPYRLSGEPVEVETTFSVTFRLGS